MIFFVLIDHIGTKEHGKNAYFVNLDENEEVVLSFNFELAKRYDTQEKADSEAIKLNSEKVVLMQVYKAEAKGLVKKSNFLNLSRLRFTPACRKELFINR